MRIFKPPDESLKLGRNPDRGNLLFVLTLKMQCKFQIYLTSPLSKDETIVVSSLELLCGNSPIVTTANLTYLNIRSIVGSYLFQIAFITFYCFEIGCSVNSKFT